MMVYIIRTYSTHNRRLEETQFIRHVRFDNPLIVKMDGKKKQGVVMLPDSVPNNTKYVLNIEKGGRTFNFLVYLHDF